jgi:hypothetical protein
VYFAEKELCTGMLNDKLVDDVGEHGKREGQLYKTRKGKGKRKPEAPVATEEVMVFKKGVFQRIRVPVAASAPGASHEPSIESGAAMLEGLSAEERQAILAPESMTESLSSQSASPHARASSVGAWREQSVRSCCWGSYFDRVRRRARSPRLVRLPPVQTRDTL